MPIISGLSLLLTGALYLNIPYNIVGFGMRRNKNLIIIGLWNLSISMITLIDYYSFTIPLKEPLGKGMFDSDKHYVIGVFNNICDLEAYKNGIEDNWESEAARGFYQTRLRHLSADITLSYGAINSHIFVELAGKACANLDSQDLLNPLIERTWERATRIDFAVDIKTDTSPKAFIEARDNKSFKSSGNKYSPTGGTEYLGGRSSERMARVYRYNAPHPRHEFLRVEAEYKGDAAKVASKSVLEKGIPQSCVDAHKAFGWIHPDWNIGELSASRITYRSFRPDTASTLLWLYGDVVTALRKATASGLLDLEEWLKFLRESLKLED